MQKTALSNLFVIDLSRVLAGPYCTMLLGDFGAEVVKIEQPGSGDGTRQWGPPWVGNFSAYYLTANRNKKSVTLNLKHDEGKRLLRQLVRQADVVVENFKVGTMARLGLGYKTLREENPGLIYCAITGYGQTGPYKERPGYDFMIQAQGGVMSITGPVEGEPHKVGVAIADITTGLFASNAILAALRHRDRTGEGQLVDVALLDSQVAWLANVAQNFFATGEPPQRYGNAHPNLVPYETFPTADGTLAVAVGSDEQFEKLCAALNAPQLWKDGRFRSNAGRVAHRVALVEMLQGLFVKQPSSHWHEKITEAGIPVSPINDIPTVLNDPQIAARNMVQTALHETEGEVTLLGPVAKLSETPARIFSAPPLLGEHTATVLQEKLGLSSAEIDTLYKNGVC